MPGPPGSQWEKLVSTSASLALQGASAPIAAGSHAALTATVANTGTVADTFVLSVRDIDPSWLTFRPPALSLAPGQRGNLTVLLTVPADATAPTNTPFLRLLAQSSGEVVAEEPLTPSTVANASTIPFPPAIGAEQPPRVVPTPLLAAGGIGAALVALLAVLFIRHSHQPLPAAAASLSCGGQPTKVASLLSDDTTTAIRLSNPDFSDMRVLHTEPAAVLPGLFDSLLALSDDNSRIAYVTANNESMDDAHLWEINVSAPAQPRELAHVATGFWAVRPVWSSDNRQVAFLALDPTLAAQHKTELELWIAGANGGLRQISSLPQLQPEDFYGDHKVPMCWATDNRTVIFDGVSGQSLASGQASVTTLTGVTTVSGAAASATVASAHVVIGPPIVVQADAPASTEPRLQVQVNTLTGSVQVVPAVAKSPPAAFNTGTPNRPTGSACAMPVFSQNDPAWRFDLMHSAGDQIGNYGCALTSTSMVLNYYGARMTPAALNACLKGSADPLYWTQAPGCTNGLVNGGSRVNFSWPSLDQDLSRGPAIVGMLRGQTGMHFVVVTAGGGGNAANYAVTDPWDATTTKTLQTFFNAGYNPAWIVTYSGAVRNCQRLVPPAGQPGVAVTGVVDGAVYRTPVHLTVTGDPKLLVSANLLNLSLDDFGTVQASGTPATIGSAGAVLSAGSTTSQAAGGTATSATSARGTHSAAPTTSAASAESTSATSATTAQTTIASTTTALASTASVRTTSHVSFTFTLSRPPFRPPRFFVTPVAIRNRPFPVLPIHADSVLSQEGIYQLITQMVVKNAPSTTATKFIIDHTPPHIDVFWLPGGAQAAAQLTGSNAVLATQRFGPAKLLALPATTLAQAATALPRSVGPAQLQVQAQDNLSGVNSVEYQADGSPWAPYSNDVNFQQVLTIAAPGHHVLSVRATDLAGNVSPVQSYAFQVVTSAAPATAPTATPQPTASATPTPPASPTPTAPPTATALAPTATPVRSVATTVSQAVATPTPTTVPNPVGPSHPTPPPPTATPTAAVPPSATAIDTPIPATLTPSPTAAPTRMATATFTPTATATPTPTSTPTATATVGVGRLAFRPSSLTFATQAPGIQSKEASVTAVNTGTAPLSFIGIAINGGSGAFVYGQNNCINDDATHPLAPNATCTVGVIFYPSAAGSYAASLDFTDTGAGSSQHVALSGVAANPPTFTPTPCAPIARASVGARLFTPSSGNPYVIVNWSSFAGCPPYSGTITAQFVTPGIAPYPPYATYPVSQPAGSLADSQMGCHSGPILYTLTLHDSTGKTVTATAQVQDTCVQIN